MDILFNLLIVGVVVIWLALVYWTWSDARRRVADRFLVVLATVVAFIPFLGPLIYLIVRPPEFLEDVHERDLEIAAAQARLSNERGHVCPHCDAPSESEFVRCPSCLRRLREPCPGCSKPLDPEWRICPYCEADPASPPAAKAAPAARRRRASAAEKSPGKAAGTTAARKTSKRSSTTAERDSVKADSPSAFDISEPEPETAG